MSRRDEIWRLNQLSADELIAQSQERLVVLADADALHQHMARSIGDVVRKKPDAALILPCTPSAQYPLLAKLINRKKISFRHARLFFMGDYADADGNTVPNFHPVSSRSAAAWLWDQVEPQLRPAEENVVFPEKYNVEELPAQMEKAGGVEACYAGVGIEGQVGFNSPESGVRDSTCRLVKLSDVAVTMNSIRSHVGGDIENFPRRAYTLGLRECLSARKIRVYCYCDTPGLDWARTVLRLAVLGQTGDDYPVTWIREHADWKVITDRNTAEQPAHVL